MHGQTSECGFDPHSCTAASCMHSAASSWALGALSQPATRCCSSRASEWARPISALRESAGAAAGHCSSATGSAAARTCTAARSSMARGAGMATDVPLASAGVHQQGRLTARPGARPSPAPAAARPGLQEIRIEGFKPGLLHVPQSYDPTRPAPLLVTLHGAGGNAKGGLLQLPELAEQTGTVLLSPQSVKSSWDVIRTGFGPDVHMLDAQLAAVFKLCSIDPQRVAIGGFSDGASYALTIGCSNGDLFGRVVAFSPGFMKPASLTGKPQVYLSHGTADRVLNIDYCGRSLVQRLQGSGYSLLYRELAGVGHTVPLDVQSEAMHWLVASS